MTSGAFVKSWVSSCPNMCPRQSWWIGCSRKRGSPLRLFEPIFRLCPCRVDRVVQRPPLLPGIVAIPIDEPWNSDLDRRCGLETEIARYRADVGEGFRDVPGLDWQHFQLCAATARFLDERDHSH